MQIRLDRFLPLRASAPIALAAKGYLVRINATWNIMESTGKPWKATEIILQIELS